MSAKNLDKHNRWRNKTVAFRVSPEEDAQIETAVKLTGLTKQDYIIRRLLCRDVVVQGNPRVYKALRDQLAAVLDELRRYRTGDRELAGLLKDQKGLDRSVEIICDSASEKPIADLRAEGLRATGALKGPGSIEAGIRWLRTRRRIVIDPTRTPETAREFQRYEHEKNRSGEYVEGYPDRDNHAIDAVRYALNRVWLRKDR